MTVNASATGAIALPISETVRPAKRSANGRSESGPSRLRPAEFRTPPPILGLPLRVASPVRGAEWRGAGRLPHASPLSARGRRGARAHRLRDRALRRAGRRARGGRDRLHRARLLL